MKWRYAMVAIALIALGLLGYFNWHNIVDALKLIKSANWPVLLLVPVIQLFSYYSNARYYQSFLAAFDYKLGLPKLYKLALGLNFVNQITPSIGITGATFLSYSLRQSDGVSAGKTTLAQYGRYALTYLSYVVLLVVALAMVYFGGGINKIVVRVVLLLVGFGILVSLLFIVAMASRRRLNKVIFLVQRLVDRVSRLFGRDQPLVGRARIRRLLREFHQGYDTVIRERRHLAGPFIYALMGNIMEVATLYIVFMALGFAINPGAVIISYAVANSVAVISVVPGDIGVFEVAMVAALSGTGVPVSVALGATLLYRIVNKALFLPIGFYFYSRALGGDTEKLKRHAAENRSDE